MVAEPIQVRSLQTPPEGYTWSPIERNRQASARRSTPLYHGAGASSAVTPVTYLPTLRIGRDRLPTACQHCGSAFLTREPPLGQHQRGLITCQTCSQQVCWLAGAITTRPGPSPVTPTPRPVTPTAAELRSMAARFTRLPSCGPACSVLYGHDALIHEAYGRQQAVADVKAAPSGLVRTGPLTVDFDARQVRVGDAEVTLSPIEYGLLTHLAANLGVLCSHREIVEAIWGAATAALWARQRPTMNPLRTNMARLRGRLGEAGRLIENRLGRGYVLRHEAAP